MRRRRGIEFLVLKNPGIAVRNEDGVQSGSQRGIDVGLRAVSDHPGGRRSATVFFDELRVGRLVLLRHDLRRLEKFPQSRAFDLAALLGERALRYQDQAMAALQLLKVSGTSGRYSIS